MRKLMQRSFLTDDEERTCKPSYSDGVTNRVFAVDEIGFDNKNSQGYIIN